MTPNGYLDTRTRAAVVMAAMASPKSLSAVASTSSSERVSKGWGTVIRFRSGRPPPFLAASANEWNQLVTKVAAGIPLFSNSMPSRTLPVVQPPQLPRPVKTT